MAKIIGRLNNLGVGKESSRGTAVSASIWVPMMDLEYEDVAKNAINEASVGRRESSDDEVVTSVSGMATMKSKIKDSSIGFFLLSILGAVNSAAMSGDNSAVYNHTFSVAQVTQLPTLSLALKGPNDDIVMPNALISTLKITAERDSYVMFEATALGMESESASNTASYTSENDFSSRHVTFKKAATQADLDAASAIAVRNLELEINSNVTLEEVLGANPVNDVLAQSFSIKGTATVIHNDSTWKTLSNTDEKVALRIQLQNTGVTIGDDQNPTLVIDLHKVKVFNRKKSGGMNEIMEESFEFNGHYKAADSKAITCILRNLKTSY